MEFVTISTETINKWWDKLTHEQKQSYIKQMNCFNWGKVISVSAISKYQKNELYQQVHNINNKRLL